MKLIYEASPVQTKCAMCKKLDVIDRKIIQAQQRVARWQAEGINPVSTEKELENITIWYQEIADLKRMKEMKMRSM